MNENEDLYEHVGLGKYGWQKLANFKTIVEELKDDKLKVTIKFLVDKDSFIGKPIKIKQRTIIFKKYTAKNKYSSNVIYIPIEKDLDKSYVAVCARDLLVMRSYIYLEYQPIYKNSEFESCDIYIKMPTTNRRKFWLSEKLWFNEEFYIKDGSETDLCYRELHPIEIGALYNSTTIKSASYKSIRQDSNELYIMDAELCFYYKHTPGISGEDGYSKTKVLYLGNLVSEFKKNAPSDWYEGDNYFIADCLADTRKIENAVLANSSSYLTDGEIGIDKKILKELQKEYEGLYENHNNKKTDVNQYDFIIKNISVDNDSTRFLVYDVKQKIAMLKENNIERKYHMAGVDTILDIKFGVNDYSDEFYDSLKDSCF